ncbi:MAG: glycosyltransferase family 4 protein [Candidatus Omnitrophica bacterium]|nr:glycosyltransferase family 4 protein [Candidatus Omnitrophota bacterium]MCB9783196.1 glycosyltransferase family 4 protein [Candidatus Omnitrophota bacterium]
MRICFLSPLIPSVAYGHRPYSFITELSALGHEITLHCLDDSGPAVGAKSHLESIGVEVRPVGIARTKRWSNCLLGLPSRTPLRVLHCQSGKLLDRLIQDVRENDYDVVHVDRFRLAPYGMKIREDFKGPVVIDFPDALSLYYERAVKNPRHFLKKWIDLREHRVTPGYERRVLSSGLSSVVCSNLDRDFLLKHAPESSIEVIPNMVDTEEFKPRSRQSDQPRGAFTGTLYYLPNIDGLLWLKEEVMPLLGDVDLPIDVIGYGATSELDSLEEDRRFKMVGYVENMADHLFQEDIYLCPLRVGAGIRFKLLEAFAAGMAAVSTTLGYEGIPCQPGEHLLVADSPAEFAAAIRHLASHPEERKRIGENARRFVVENFSSKATGKQLESLYQDLLASG